MYPDTGIRYRLYHKASDCLPPTYSDHLHKAHQAFLLLSVIYTFRSLSGHRLPDFVQQVMRLFD